MAESGSIRKLFEVLLDSARQDLAVCRLLNGNADISDAMVGFHAQQCSGRTEAELSCSLNLHDLLQM